MSSFIFTPQEIFNRLQSTTVTSFYEGVNGVSTQELEAKRVREQSMRVSGVIYGFKRLPIQFTGMINQFVNFQTNATGGSTPRRGSNGRGGSFGNDQIIVG